jgi:hypothetical protein
MITGMHAMFYSAKHDELRAFFRDKLRFPFTDVGGGWLIFDLPSGDLGVHPTDGPRDTTPPNTHQISFFCDDVRATVAELAARGVEFADEVEDHGYGLVTHIVAPGDLKIQLYQPKYGKSPRAAV